MKRPPKRKRSPRRKIKMKRKSNRALICFLALLLAAAMLPLSVFSGSFTASTGISLKTTLVDNMTVKNDRLTFDVWARDGDGKKIASNVTLNGEQVNYTWDDGDKTSYTLVFSQVGENTVVISAASDGGEKTQATYHIFYQPAAVGEVIGRAVWSVEVFTIGCGYLVLPVEFPIIAGESAADGLVRLLHLNGFVGYYSGTTDSGFYLGYIADGDSARSAYNGYKKSGTASNPKKLGICPSIPEYLQPYLESYMGFYDPEDYINNCEGYLGEFVISNGSGWMYSVNNNFPNVSFSDVYLSDGDIVRVQFTLGYGDDIGGAAALGGGNPQSGYYPVADKDALTSIIAKAGVSNLLTHIEVQNAYFAALTVAAKLDASQSAVDEAANALEDALENHDADGSGDENENTDNSESESNTGVTTPSVDSDTQTSTTLSSKATDEGTPKLPGDTKPSASQTAGTQNEEKSRQGGENLNIIIPAIIVTSLIVVLAIALLIFFGRKKASSKNSNDKGQSNRD